MLRLLVIIFLILVVYRAVRTYSLKNSRKRFNNFIDESETKFYTDPVCGQKVARCDAHLLWQDGQTYGFCSKECLCKFDQTAEWKL